MLSTVISAGYAKTKDAPSRGTRRKSPCQRLCWHQNAPTAGHPRSKCCPEDQSYCSAFLHSPRDSMSATGLCLQNFGNYRKMTHVSGRSAPRAFIQSPAADMQQNISVLPWSSGRRLTVYLRSSSTSSLLVHRVPCQARQQAKLQQQSPGTCSAGDTRLLIWYALQDKTSLTKPAFRLWT